jgi:ribosomal protein S18 acetylase RimI-like enzyme
VIDTCTLLDRLPTPSEHRRLAEAVGWAHAFEWGTMPASLEGSLAGVIALDSGQVIGMGRLVGDGVKYFYVQDLAVLPAYQGRGIGTALLHRLLCATSLPEG